MKIGFFTDSYFPEIDGVTYTIDCWREELERNGHEVYVVYPDGDYEPGEREIPVRSVPNPFYAGYRIPLFRRPSTLPDLDVVHCHGPAPVGILGRYYAQTRDVPAIYTHHTPIEEYFHQSVKLESIAAVLRKLYLPWENAFLRSFDIVTASTNRIDRDVRHVQLPVGVDTEFFRPTEADRDFDFDSRVDSDSDCNSEPTSDTTPTTEPDRDRPVIGYSGRLSMEKNVGEICRLAADCPEYEFAIVGEGPRRNRLERDAPDNVAFHDFLPRDELPAFYSSIDVFVTASTADTLGLSTLEANACGTPVVAADVPPFDRTIGPENGVRFAYGDLEAMADAIETCVAGDWNTRAAVEEYDVRRTIARLEHLYHDVPLSREAALATDELPWEFSNEEQN